MGTLAAPQKTPANPMAASNAVGSGAIQDMALPAAFDTLEAALAAIEADSAGRNTPPASLAVLPRHITGGGRSTPVRPARGT